MNLTFNEAEDEIVAVLAPAWAAAPISPTPPVDWGAPEVVFNVPSSAPWGRIRTHFNGARRASLGPINRGNQALFRRRGIVFIEIYIPENGDKYELQAQGEAMVNALEGVKTPGGVRFGTLNNPVSFLTLADEAPWMRGNVVAPFEFSRLK